LYLLGRSLSVVWSAARGPLRDATLAAIFRRVFADARRRFRVLEELRLEPTEACFLRLRGQPEVTASAEDVRAATRFLLVELLSVLGHLTAELLTPSIHAELTRVGGNLFAEAASGLGLCGERVTS
jgi:hypothetical protein